MQNNQTRIIADLCILISNQCFSIDNFKKYKKTLFKHIFISGGLMVLRRYKYVLQRTETIVLLCKNNVINYKLNMYSNIYLL